MTAALSPEQARLATVAHLCRLLDVPPERIEKALAHLEARGLIELHAPDRTPKS